MPSSSAAATEIPRLRGPASCPPVGGNPQSIQLLHVSASQRYGGSGIKTPLGLGVEGLCPGESLWGPVAICTPCVGHSKTCPTLQQNSGYTIQLGGESQSDLAGGHLAILTWVSALRASDTEPLARWLLQTQQERWSSATSDTPATVSPMFQ